MGTIEHQTEYQIEYQPHQIVFLECESQRLYAEVIQTVTDRNLCWARPLAIVAQDSSVLNSAANSTINWAVDIATAVLLDLRQASDLLLPLPWFQAAVDTEVIPILAQLSGLKSEGHSADPGTTQSSGDRLSTQGQLQHFVQAICQGNQNRSN